MITIVFSILLILLYVLSFFVNEGKDKNIEGLVYFAISLIMVLLVGTRTPGVDADSLAYVGNYYNLGSSLTETLEPSFFLIANIAKLFGEVQVLFIIYALLAIPLKTYAIFRLSNFRLLSMMVWIAHFFLLQDMTQIRVAVATAIFLYALSDLIEGNKKRYLLLCACAVFFHYSALVLFPIAIFSCKHMGKYWKIFLSLTPVVFYLMYFRGIDLVSLIPLGAFQDKLDAYERLRDKGIAGDEINIFNMLAMFRLLTYYMLILFYETIYKKCKAIGLYLKIYCVSICCYVGLSFLPALAIRGSEVFAVIDVVAIPCLCYIVKPSWAMKVAVGIFAIGLFVMNIVLSRYIREFV